MENLVVDAAFWRGKKVFLTGHTGFKGSWLSLMLQHLGAEVTGYALPPPTRPSLFEVARVGEGMHSLQGDVRDLHHLQSAMREFRPDVAMHLAAQPLVRLSYDEPVETYATNVMGTVHFLEAVRHCDTVRAVVNVTSDKCYQNREWDWGYRENDPLGGLDPYSNSKGCSEMVTTAYRHSFFHAERYASHGVALASARAGNVIGGGDWALDRLVPDILRAFEEKRLPLIRNPRAIRPWQHVLEPLRGYLMLARGLYTEGLAFAEGWNFGPRVTDCRTVGEVAQRLGRLLGVETPYVTDTRRQPHEAGFLKLDCSRAENHLAWAPHTDLEAALGMVAEWYRAYWDQQAMQAFTLTQIRDHLRATSLNPDSPAES
ncbi:MAG: CDP-glucose 4,6-dehydratase [Magnetococcales bacterium]|nr:CDP-glucose 4,6-dehydratase [Magnetococcales bacterium]